MFFVGGKLTIDEEKVARENNISQTTHILCKIEDLFDLELQQYEWANMIDEELPITIKDIILLGNKEFNIGTIFLSNEIIAIPKKEVKASIYDIPTEDDLYPRQEVYIERFM